MSKIKNNPIMKGASGMLGDVVVYREVRGNLIMSNRPRKRQVLTPHQEATKSRFMRAVQYAKKQVADPASKALYQPAPLSKFTSAYTRAITDYLNAPVISLIDTTMYAGTVGDEIFIRAYDDFQLVSVVVSVYNAAGDLLEQGVPVLLENATDDYVYRATVVNGELPGTKVRVILRDRPGNTTVGEKIL